MRQFYQFLIAPIIKTSLINLKLVNLIEICDWIIIKNLDLLMQSYRFLGWLVGRLSSRWGMAWWNHIRKCLSAHLPSIPYHQTYQLINPNWVVSIRYLQKNIDDKKKNNRTTVLRHLPSSSCFGSSSFELTSSWFSPFSFLLYET